MGINSKKKGKRMNWTALFDDKREATFACPNPQPIPTIHGSRYLEKGDGETEVRIFQYSTNGEWGVQVTTTRTARCKTAATAKRKALELAREMEGK